MMGSIREFVMPKRASFLSGEAFRHWRTKRGLTQEQAADLLGVNRTAIGNMEVRGVSKAYALAFSAIDHRLKPWAPDNDPQ